ncbi:MAG: hypothetical protein JW767_06610 [Thermoleophilia bacterium]|nr:hypothetical protein [Thermoleophilia bacterium]
MPAIVLLTATFGLVLAALAAALTGCGGGDAAPGATASSPAAASEPGAAPEPATTAATGDPLPPAAQAVYLLGGSAARECVESNAAWGAAIRAAGGPEVLAVDLGATNQSFSADRRLVRGMPKGSVVLIGVSLGRYTSPPPRALGDKPLTAEARAALAGEVEIRHRYSEKRIQTDERKGEILELWLAERYELYRRNYEANHEELERLVRACRDRGLRVALLELPINLEFVGDRLDDPRERYLEDCRHLAAVSSVPFLSFVEEVGLRNTEFYDLMHLVEPGRQKWQVRLAEEVVALLDASR